MAAETRLTLDSTIREVLEARNSTGRDLLFEHGYDIGHGFVDVLSQHQSLREAARSGRLRDVDHLLAALNPR